MTPVQLSPFIVSTSGDEGYRAANTLSGTRMNASLFQTPAAISVLTKELLDDIGAQTTEDYLRFATNSDHDPITTAGNQVGQHSDVQVKIRGFTGASLTRDYFSYPGANSDRFNIERIEANRGPNAVLYGIGGPGGVLNISSKQAVINGRRRSASFTTGNYDKKRSEADLALPLIKDRLSLRLNSLYEDKGGWAEFEFERRKGLALAGTYQPFANTVVRAAWEGIDSTINRAATFPFFDGGGTAWLAAGAKRSAAVLPGTNPDPANLISANQQSVFYAPQLRSQPFRLSTLGGADMRPDVAGVQASGFWQTITPPAAPVGVGVDDPYYGTLIPKRANIGGSGNIAKLDYSIASLFLEQRFGRNFFLELAGSQMVMNRRNFYPTSNVNRLMGDANSVLPGAYYADGDATIANAVNPGRLLPDIGAVNPYAGSLYVEARASIRYQDWDSRYLRGTLGYVLDLHQHRRWLGVHRFALMGQRDEVLHNNFTQAEYNVTPGNRNAIDTVSNQILRRTYIDFNSPNGARGMIDPWTNPIPTSSGVTAAWLNQSPTSLSSTVLKSAMAAVQSGFFEDRIVVTGGLRRDKQANDIASEGGKPVPNSNNLWYTEHRTFAGSANRRDFSGDTKTYGLFIAPLRWLALTYNQSNSILPLTGYDILANPLGTRHGEGRDLGLRLNLLRETLYLNVNLYENNDVNRSYSEGIQQLANIFNPIVRGVFDTLKTNGQPLPAVYRAAGLTDFVTGSSDVANSSGEGVEVELVGQIRPNWRVSFNYSHSLVKLDRPGTRSNEFYAAVRNEWQGDRTLLSATPANVQEFVRKRDGTPGRDFVLNPATIADSYQAAGDVLNTINAAQGQAPLGNITDSLNVFTSYSLGTDVPGVLRQVRLGGGANYRSAAVIGFDASRNNAPILGASSIIWNLMLGKRFPLRRRGSSLDFQLNVNNVFGNEKLVPYSATPSGQIVRYDLPRVRQTWDLRVTYGF